MATVFEVNNGKDFQTYSPPNSITNLTSVS